MMPLKKSLGSLEADRPKESLQDYIRHLEGVSLFADIKDLPKGLASVAALLEAKTYPPQSSIITEGETGSEMYILIEGEASVYKTTTEGELYKVALLHGQNHAFFGEGALLDSDARSATIKADTECYCLVLKREAFENFSGEHPDWALPVLRRIARAVMARLRKANGDLMLLYNALVSEIRGH